MIFSCNADDILSLGPMICGTLLFVSPAVIVVEIKLALSTSGDGLNQSESNMGKNVVLIQI